MKTSLILALTLIGGAAFAQQSLGGPSGGTTTPTSLSGGTLSGSQGGTLGTSTTTSTLGTTSSIPQVGTTVPGTSAGSPQSAGPLSAAPNGAGGTYGYPNNAIDPTTSTPGMQQPIYYGGPYYNYGGGTVSGTTSSVNPSGAPFVAPPGPTGVPPVPFAPPAANVAPVPMVPVTPPVSR